MKKLQAKRIFIRVYNSECLGHNSVSVSHMAEHTLQMLLMLIHRERHHFPTNLGYITSSGLEVEKINVFDYVIERQNLQ